MAKQRHYKKRRRKGSFSFLYKLLTFVVICGAITVALALFFKAETITVSGNSTYTDRQIVDASGIQTGDNLYLLNKFEAADKITRTLPYIEQVQMRRHLPSTLVITVKECTAPAAIEQDGKLWLISGTGKVVGTDTAANAESYTLITGISLLDPEIGTNLQTAPEDAAQGALLQSLLALLDERDMLGDTRSIRLDDADSIVLQYLERFEVTIPRDADLAYKLDYLLAVVERLEANETGTIDMTQDNTASFIPKTKTVRKTSPTDVASASDLNEAVQ